MTTINEDSEQEHSDPLDGAAIGETVTIRESVDLPVINFSPDVYFGSDRFGDCDVAGLELVEDADGHEAVRVVFEGEVTKQLPRRWDYHREPVTAEEKRAHWRKTWLKRAGQAAAFVLPFAFAGLIATRVMNGLAGVTLNGEPMAPASGTDIWLSVVPILVVAALIAYGLQGGFPGTVRGGHR